MQNRPVRAEIFHSDGQTNRKKLIVVFFSQFLYRPLTHRKQTFMALARFDPDLPAIKLLHTYVLDSTHTGTGAIRLYIYQDAIIRLGFTTDT
jgi:hypothetical protein